MAQVSVFTPNQGGGFGSGREHGSIYFSSPFSKYDCDESAAIYKANTTSGSQTFDVN